jgi:hypothetical protein
VVGIYDKSEVTQEDLANLIMGERES